MDFNEISVGIDMEENQRFADYDLKQDSNFLNKIFSQIELDYCFSKTNPAQHLCARFAAKEAALKALRSLGFAEANYGHINVINNESNAPLLNIDKLFKVVGKVSLSHTKQNSIAIVMIKKHDD